MSNALTFSFSIPIHHSTEPHIHRSTFTQNTLFPKQPQKLFSRTSQTQTNPTCVYISSWRAPNFLLSSILPPNRLPSFQITPSNSSNPHFPHQPSPTTKTSPNNKPPKPPSIILRFLLRLLALITTATLITLSYIGYTRLNSLIPDIPQQYAVEQTTTRRPRVVRLSRNGVVVSNVAVKNAVAKEIHVGVVNPVGWLLGKEKAKLDLVVVRPVVFVGSNGLFGNGGLFGGGVKDGGGGGEEGVVRNVRVVKGCVVVEGVGVVGGDIRGMLRRRSESGDGVEMGNGKGFDVELVGRKGKGTGRLRGCVGENGFEMSLGADSMHVGTGLLSGDVRVNDKGAWGELDVEDGAWEGQDIWAKSINGRVRFDGVRLNADGVNVVLGELPMVLFGGFDMGKRWEVAGFVDEVGVESILETVDVENFFPVKGRVGGAVALNGAWEEPILSGWAETKDIAREKKCDSLDVDRASMSFAWNINAGVVDFRDIDFTIVGGGEVTGSGGIFYDMTTTGPQGVRARAIVNPTLCGESKLSENGFRLPNAAKKDVPVQILDVVSMDAPESNGAPYKEHHAYSPKGKLPGNMQALPSPPEPSSLVADPFAKYRLYDSLQFNIRASNVPCRTLLNAYGGEHIAPTTGAPLGLVDLESIVSGPVSDAVAEVAWRLSPDGLPEPSVSDNGKEENKDRKDTLVGNVQVALGDSFASRRVKIRANVERFDASQLAGRLQKVNENFFNNRSQAAGKEHESTNQDTSRSRFERTLKQVYDPQDLGTGGGLTEVRTSGDIIFEGHIRQKLLPKQTNPRMPLVEFVGAHGVLGTRDLKINELFMPGEMGGRFLFGSDETFSLHLADEAGSNYLGVEQSVLRQRNGKVAKDATTRIALRLRDSFLNLNKRGQELSLEATQFPLASCFPASNAVLGESLDASIKMDVRARRGRGSIMIHNLSPSPIIVDGALSSPNKTSETDHTSRIELHDLGGYFEWANNSVSLRDGVLRQPQSEYRVEGTVQGPGKGTTAFENMAYDFKVAMKEVNLSEMASSWALLAEKGAMNSGTSMGRSTSGLNPHQLQSDTTNRKEDVWNSSNSYGQNTRPASGSSFIPYTILTDNKSGTGQGDHLRPESRPDDDPSHLPELEGSVSGTLNVKHSTSTRERDRSLKKTRSAEENVADLYRLWKNGFDVPSDVSSLPPSNAVPSIFYYLKGTSVNFDITGVRCVLGSRSAGHIVARGRLSEKVIELESFRSKNEQECEVVSSVRLEANKRIKGKVKFQNADVSMINRYASLPVEIGGNLAGHFEFQGSISDPKVNLKVDWNDGTIDRKAVHDAGTTLVCRDGRCELDAKAFFDTQSKTSKVKPTAAMKPGKGNKIRQVSSRKSRSKKRTTNIQPEGLSFSASAPLPLYLKQISGSRQSFGSGESSTAAARSTPDSKEWISLDMRVKKHGILFLNCMFPQLGIRTGNSDLSMTVRGTASEPLVSGNAKLQRIGAWPSILNGPIALSNCEVDIDENLVTLKSLRGKYGSQTISGQGELPLFGKRSAQPRGDATNYPEEVGLLVSFGKVGIHLSDKFHGDVLGTARVTGSASDPTISGNVTLSNGVIFLANSDANLLKALLPSKTVDPREKDFGKPLVAERNQDFGGKKVVNIDNTFRGKNGNLQRQRSEFDDAHDYTRPIELDAISNGRFGAFRMKLGKDVQIVYPYLLKLGASGTLDLSGPLEAPLANGLVKFNSGGIHILTRKMKIKHGAMNVARFTNTKSVFEPTINLTLEDRDLRVHLNNATPKTWAKALHISGKGGEELDRQNVKTLFQYRLSSVKFGDVPRAISKLLATYLEDACALTANVGSFAKVKLFPAMVESVQEGEWEDLGYEIEADTKMVTLGMKRSFSGSTAVVVGFRPMDNMELNIEADRSVFRARFGIRFGGSSSGKKVKTSGAGMGQRVADGIERKG